MRSSHVPALPSLRSLVAAGCLAATAVGCIDGGAEQGDDPGDTSDHDKSTLSLVFERGEHGSVWGDGDCQHVAVFTKVRWSTETSPRLDVGLNLLDAWFNYLDLAVYDAGSAAARQIWDAENYCKTLSELGGAMAAYAAYMTWPENAFRETHKQLTAAIAAKLRNPAWSQANELPEINQWIDASACVLARQVLLEAWKTLLADSTYLRYVQEYLGFDLSAADTPTFEAAMTCPDLKAPLSWSPRA